MTKLQDATEMQLLDMLTLKQQARNRMVASAFATSQAIEKEREAMLAASEARYDALYGALLKLTQRHDMAYSSTATDPNVPWVATIEEHIMSLKNSPGQQERADKLQAEVHKLMNELSTLQHSIKGREGHIKALETDSSNGWARVRQLTAEAASMITTINQQEARYSALVTKLSHLTAELP